MPSGQVHHEYHQGFMPVVVAMGAVWVAWSLLIGAYYYTVAGVWFVFWYWTGRYIDPDLDLQGVTMAEGRMLRELDILGVFLVPVTAFYAAATAYAIRKLGVRGAIGGSHRTWLTHSLIPGTLGRQLLICSILWFVLNSANRVIFALLGGTLKFATWDLVAFAIGQFLGLGLADAIHILLDKYYGGE